MQDEIEALKWTYMEDDKSLLTVVRDWEWARTGIAHYTIDVRPSADEDGKLYVGVRWTSN